MISIKKNKTNTFFKSGMLLKDIQKYEISIRVEMFRDIKFDSLS